MSAAVDVLTRARARIENPDRWTQGEMARNSDGGGVQPDSPDATCWCLIGSMIAEGAGWNGRNSFARPFLDTAALPVFPEDANDTGTHADALAVLDRAIALAREAPDGP